MKIALRSSTLMLVLFLVACGSSTYRSNTTSPTAITFGQCATVQEEQQNVTTNPSTPYPGANIAFTYTNVAVAFNVSSPTLQNGQCVFTVSLLALSGTSVQQLGTLSRPGSPAQSYCVGSHDVCIDTDQEWGAFLHIAGCGTLAQAECSGQMNVKASTKSVTISFTPMNIHKPVTTIVTYVTGNGVDS